MVEDQPTFVARWQVGRVAERAFAPVYAVNAACLVPPALIAPERRSRSGFLRQHEPERTAWLETQDETPDIAPYTGALPFVPDDLMGADLDDMVSTLGIDHSLPVSAMHLAGRVAAVERLARRLSDVLPSYASTRNDGTRPEGASGLSPYLHFGVIGPREIMARVAAAQAGGQHKRKFADELLGWREWFHFQARQLNAPEHYDRVADWARATLGNHARDPRPDAEPLERMLRGETRDETWNVDRRGKRTP